MILDLTRQQERRRQRIGVGGPGEQCYGAAARRRGAGQQQQRRQAGALADQQQVAGVRADRKGLAQRPDHVERIAGATTGQPGQAALVRLVEQADLAQRRLGRRDEQRPAQQRVVAARPRAAQQQVLAGAHAAGQLGRVQRQPA